MAKKTSTYSPPVRISPEVLSFDLQDRLPGATEKQSNQDLYSNYVHVAVSEYDTMLDFYRVSRIPGKADIELIHLQKIFLPSSIAKSLIDALSRSISSYEKESGREIISAGNIDKNKGETKSD